jgi:tetratricopeptide (TPR) repeat protein
LLTDPCADAWLNDIAQEVDHLPLALEIVASYLRDTRQNPGEWLKEWHNTPEPTMEHLAPDAIHYPRSLARVWEQSEAHLSASARTLLRQLAWMAHRPATFPLEVFNKQEDWFQWRKAFVELAKASFITWPDNTDEISIHRILQSVMRHRLSKEEKGVALDAALESVSDALPSPEWSEDGWRLWERLATHCKGLLGYLCNTSHETDAARLMNQLGFWYLNRAQYSDAEPLMRRALAINKESFGAGHPQVARALNNLAQFLKDTNRRAEAEPLMRRALAITEASFGNDHPNVAIHLNNLASLLQDTNRLAEAEPLMRRALAIAKESFGNDHPNVAIHISNLA